MSKKPLILGIESSCDETAASIISENDQGNPIVLSNIVSSQVDIHKEFGGVVPELAARSHMEKIDWIVQKAIDDGGVNINELDAVASTAGPGLIVCLSVGLSFGKAFAASLNKPFIAVNHLEGHALSPKLNSKLDYPYLLLLISGGHSQYLSVKDLAAWLIKTRKKDVQRISAALNQQIVFHRGKDKAYADKMERTRKEVYKKLDRKE